jgi:hypothetical protein
MKDAQRDTPLVLVEETVIWRQTYELDAQTAMRDVDAFVKAMQERRLVRAVSDQG